MLTDYYHLEGKVVLRRMPGWAATYFGRIGLNLKNVSVSIERDEYIGATIEFKFNGDTDSTRQSDDYLPLIYKLFDDSAEERYYSVYSVEVNGDRWQIPYKPVEREEAWRILKG